MTKAKKTWRNAAGGALVLAICSTLWELVWSNLIPPDHSKLIEIVFGVLHGASLVASLGFYLGWLKGGVLRGSILGLIWGGIAAVSFYLASPLLLFGLAGALAAFFFAWLVFWIGVSASWRQLGEARISVSTCLKKGVFAALSAAPGFAAVLFLWAHRSLDFGIALSFGAWFLAGLPGLAMVLRDED